MAVTPPPGSPAGGHGVGAPGAHSESFEPDPRRTAFYRVSRGIIEALLFGFFQPVIRGKELVPKSGPMILAPVHRSFADFGFSAFLTERKIFYMAKDTLWRNRLLGRFLDHVGVFPVHREGADRDALHYAQRVLERGQVLTLFPEGTRQEGPRLAPLHEGAAFLAARTGAPIVPIGIGGSDLAMPKGRTIPRRLRIEVVVGEPITAPARGPGGRVSRKQVHALTEELARKIQALYDEARAPYLPGGARYKPPRP